MKKDSETGNNFSGTFKTGAVSLAFLIIGFQSALFINRAAELRILESRDHPDTVFITKTIYAAENDATPKQPVSTDTVFHVSQHRHAVKETRARTAPQAFRFNPNTVGMDDLMRLGFTERQAQSIINYRDKGGRFRRKSDFAASFVVSEEMFARLESFIDIPLIDINKADSTEFDSLPGIGPYFASRMVSYRAELGGYSCPEQLMDIYRFDIEKFNALRDLISCSAPEPYPLWTLPAEELRKHPYIKTVHAARGIVLYRENTPPDELSVEGIIKAGILDGENASKLARCVIASPGGGG